MSDPTPAISAPEKTSWLRHVLTAFGPLVGLVAVGVLFAVLRYDTFVSRDNFSIVMQQTAVIGIAALGMTLVIIAGGIDLSVGSIIALGTVVIALLIEKGVSPFSRLWVAWGLRPFAGACPVC